MVGLHDENLQGMFFIVIFKGSFWGRGCVWFT